jgi:hypothetical protein
VKSYQEKVNFLTAKVRDYGVEAPCVKRDLTLICPSYHKSIEFNRLLLTVQQACLYLHTKLNKKIKGVPACN